MMICLPIHHKWKVFGRPIANQTPVVPYCCNPFIHMARSRFILVVRKGAYIYYLRICLVDN